MRGRARKEEDNSEEGGSGVRERGGRSTEEGEGRRQREGEKAF